MEAFSLLRYWRGGGGGVAAASAPAPAGISTADTTPNTNTNTNTNTDAATAILTAVAQNDVETDSDDNDDSDDGPFFDLEFTLPDEADDSSEDPHQNPNENHSEEENDGTSEDSSEREIKFTLSPSSNDHSDPNLSVSDDVFLEGKLVQLEPSSFVLNSSSEPNSKPPPQFTAALLKSATKFRVFMLGLKKPKPIANASSSEKDPTGSDPVSPKQPPQQKTEPRQQQKKLFTVKFKVEEVPIMSLFTRDNSSRAKASASNNKDESQTQTQTQTQALSSASDDKRLVHKYLRMVKPLYIRVSRKYAEKLRFSGQLNVSDSVSAAAEKRAPQAKAVVAEEEEKEGDNNDDGSEGAGTNVKGTQKQGNLPLPAGLRVVCKHLGKSRSASSAAAPATSGPAPAGLVSSRRRDDSLLQQQDGIQGAILHCKRSFNASRGKNSFLLSTLQFVFIFVINLKIFIF